MSGKLCIVGYHQGEPRSVDLARWNWMAFQILNAHFRSIDTIMTGMRAGMRLLDAGAFDVAPLVSNIYPLAAITDAFETAAAKPPGFVKAVVEPNAQPEVERNSRLRVPNLASTDFTDAIIEGL
jgi:threonine dehydrogenase-like Zn-dependent dehydrogenase